MPQAGDRQPGSRWSTEQKVSQCVQHPNRGVKDPAPPGATPRIEDTVPGGQVDRQRRLVSWIDSRSYGRASHVAYQRPFSDPDPVAGPPPAPVKVLHIEEVIVHH